MVQQEAYLKYGILMLFALYIWNKDVISRKIQISPDKGETTLLVIIFISKKPDPAPSSSAADSVLINDEICGIRAHLGFSSNPLAPFDRVYPCLPTFCGEADMSS